eukprot:633785-Amphidinium_carterae.1
MPNMTDIAPDALAMLVSLEVLELQITDAEALGNSTLEARSRATYNTSTKAPTPTWEIFREYPDRSGDVAASQAERRQRAARPVLFKISEPLLTLAPVAVEPCCDLKISGGEALTIWGAVPATAVARGEAVVRFRGAQHQKVAQADLELNDGAMPSLAAAVESSGGEVQETTQQQPIQLQANLWRLRVITPPWPKAEGHIVLETSWNGQQFVAFRSPMRVVEEKSLFGDVSEGITEDVEGNLWESEPDSGSDGRSDASAAGAAVSKFEARNVIEDQLFTVVNDNAVGQGGGKGIDMSKVVLVGHEGDSFVLSRGRDVSFLQEDLRLIHDLFLLLAAAALGATAAVSINTPTIIGFLLGGIVVGPGGMNVITQLVQVESVAELGICMLLLCLGLDLIWEDLLSNTRAALAGILSMAVLCCLIVFFADFVTETPRAEALCIGLFSALSSTPMSLRAIAQPSSVPSAAAAIETSMLLSILVTQDVAFAALLALCP